MLIWLLGLGGGAIVLALLMHFVVPAQGIKIPAVILGTLGGMVVGAILGLVGSVYYGDQVHKTVYADMYKPDPMGGASPKPAPQGPPAPPKKKAAAEPGVNVGAGVAPIPGDYPGIGDFQKKRADAGAAKKKEADPAKEKDGDVPPK